MSCTKNKKSFLGIKYEGPHCPQVVRIGRFMLASTTFMARSECKYCGAQQINSFVTECDLLRMGVDIKDIITHRTIIF